MKHHIPESRQREKPTGNYTWIGKSMKRVEDPRLLTGHGKYADDIVVPNLAHAAVLRSPHAHARIVSVDKTRAEAVPGVLAVMSGADVAEVTDELPSFASPPVPQRCVALDRVRHVGEPVAAVVAETRYIAEDACELIEVVYDELPPVVDPEEAITMTGDAVLHPERGETNVALARKLDFGPVDEDFAAADVVVKRHLRWPRSGGQPLENAGALATFDPGTGKFEIYANTQMYTFIGWTIARSLRVPSRNVNIIPTLAGGSFGAKVFIHKVMTIAATLARATGRPVKYLEDRIDDTTACDAHGSDRIYDAELALKKDGTMTSLRFRVVDDYGAYFQYGAGHHGNAMAQVTGPYRINSFGIDLIAVLTNKCQIGAYRGFGSEVTNWVMERMVDAAVDELGADPVEFRRQNLIQPDQFPYIIPTGNLYDSGNYPAVLDMALELSDYYGWRKKQAEARKQGRYVGIGIVSCQERSVYNSTEWWMFNLEPGFDLSSTPESVAISMDPTGMVSVALFSPFTGNSPETVATQVVAEQLQMDPKNIFVTYADSDAGLAGTGPSGSRYTVMVAGAIVGAATEIREKLLKVAGHMMEVDPKDLELRDGKVGVKGVPGDEKTLQEVATFVHYFRLSLPEDPELNSGLDAICVYDHPLTTLPSEDRSDLGIFYPFMGHMVHIPVVEVDIETGQVGFLDYTAVHDCGTMVNPMTLEGHIRGGTINGIGSTLYEHFHYDENGQLLNATFSDYLLPGLRESPIEIRVGHIETPSPYTEYGVKGGGEGGRMGAPPALTQAVEDALKPLGVKIDELPISPKRLRALIREAEQKVER
jgi:CO/xanthine dehydrogenase Mo-binding subunit